MRRGATGHIEGMKEAREALQELSRATQTNVGKRALQAPAHVFEIAIKAKAPVSGRPSDPTRGSLRASIKVVPDKTRKGSPRVAILADDVAAVPNEFGTSKMSPQPFFRPAVDASRVIAARAMAEAVKAEVDVAVRRAARRKAK